jgi:hypothetical protein
MHGITVEIQPEFAYTIAQTVNSVDTGASTWEELVSRFTDGSGKYELVDQYAIAGSFETWKDGNGFIGRYRSILRYDASEIPRFACILRARLIWYGPMNITDSQMADFDVLLSRCRFTNEINETTLAQNFRLAEIGKYITIGSNAEISRGLYDPIEIEIPTSWVSRNRFTDLGILSGQEIADNCLLGRQRVTFPLLISPMLNQSPTDYRPTLVIEYLEIHRGKR